LCSVLQLVYFFILTKIFYLYITWFATNTIFTQKIVQQLKPHNDKLIANIPDFIFQDAVNLYNENLNFLPVKVFAT